MRTFHVVSIRAASGLVRTTRATLLTLVISAMTACNSGDSGQQGAQAPGASGGSNAPKGNASAAEVAKEMRGRVRCPANIATAPRASGAPVDDVLGVRPGMTFEEAANVVLCTHDLMVVQADPSRGFQIQTFGQKIRQGFNARFAEPRIQKSSKQIMEEMQDDMMARSGNAVRQDMQPGQAKWFVGTMGMPGQERVLSAAREEWFEQGKNPTMANVEQALAGKYGKPTKAQTAGPNHYITWAYDPLGRLITETSPLFNQCSGTADPNGGANVTPDCGVVVTAIVYSLRENPELSKYMQVGVVNQAAGHQMLTATEQAFQQMDAQQRAKQVEEAGKNANAPQL